MKTLALLPAALTTGGGVVLALLVTAEQPLRVRPVSTDFVWTTAADEIPNALHPQYADVPIQESTLDWASGVWVDPSPVEADEALTAVFDNTCSAVSPPVVYLFVPLDQNNRVYDGGRIPSTGDPNAPVGATDANLIKSFTFEYCTYEASPDIEIAFYESHAVCQSPPLIPPTPPLATYQVLGAPGSPGGGLSCHSVTVDLSDAPFCIKSDGDGIWDNKPSLDNFTWSFKGFTNGLTGPLVAGDPQVAPFGDCTYSNPCGACGGTGLGTQDGFLIEELVPGGGGLPTTCYWFTGVVYASLSMRLESDGPCCGTAVNYCTAGTSNSGCQALLFTVGVPSATASSGFELIATSVEGDKDGLFFMGINGRQAKPWGAGSSFQCVVPPVARLGLLPGIGTQGLCDGKFTQALNALWCPTCPKPQKNPGAGTLVQAQLWYRDPFNKTSTSLSNAIEFLMCP